MKADEVVCAITPSPFYAVGQFYRDFSQTTDDEVRELMMQTVPIPDDQQLSGYER